jgi:HPt (histidine-containing phosphotransfer) domain-containing protein
MENMQAAYADENWDELTRLAHWLKGAGGTVGFSCLTDSAGELEQAARQHDGCAANDSLDELSLLADRIAPAPASAAPVCSAAN